MEAHRSPQMLPAWCPMVVHKGAHHLANCSVEPGAHYHGQTLVLLIFVIPHLAKDTTSRYQVVVCAQHSYFQQWNQVTRLHSYEE